MASYIEEKTRIYEEIKKKGSCDCLAEEGQCNDSTCIEASVMCEMGNLVKGSLGKMECVQEIYQDQMDGLWVAIDAFFAKRSLQ
jgi:hypothetical protein